MQDQQFSPEFIRHLRSVCKHHPHALGFSDADIHRALGVTVTTVRSYLRKYAQDLLVPRVYLYYGVTVYTSRPISVRIPVWQDSCLLRN